MADHRDWNNDKAEKMLIDFLVVLIFVSLLFIVFIVTS